MLAKKLPGTSLFCHEASANQPIQVKKHHGLHELKQSEYCPKDGWDGSQERSKGFGDVRREKSGESVSTKAEDQRKPGKVSMWAQPWGTKRAGYCGRSHECFRQATFHRDKEPKRGKGCKQGSGDNKCPRRCERAWGQDSHKSGRTIGNIGSRQIGPSTPLRHCRRARTPT